MGAAQATFSLDVLHAEWRGFATVQPVLNVRTQALQLRLAQGYLIFQQRQPFANDLTCVVVATAGELRLDEVFKVSASGNHGEYVISK